MLRIEFDTCCLLVMLTSFGVRSGWLSQALPSLNSLAFVLLCDPSQGLLVIEQAGEPFV